MACVAAQTAQMWVVHSRQTLASKKLQCCLTQHRFTCIPQPGMRALPSACPQPPSSQGWWCHTVARLHVLCASFHVNICHSHIFWVNFKNFNLYQT